MKLNKETLKSLRNYLEQHGVTIQGLSAILSETIPEEVIIQINRQSGGDTVVLYIVTTLLLQLMEESTND